MSHVNVAVIGAGFGGLAALGSLRRAGVDSVVAFERADAVGGTWRDNTYPGCACDVPSHLYSLSFAPNPSWTRSFSGQAEIQRYLSAVAVEHDLVRDVRFGEELRSARWDDEAQRWALETTTLRVTADVLVDGSGGLIDPALPELPGLDRFAGTVFHSARWRHDHDLSGRRVAAIGTGASAIQFVPAITPDVARLLVVQRTAPWVIPRLDRPTTRLERRALAALPALQQLARAAQYNGRETFMFPIMTSRTARRALETLARVHLRRQVADPHLRARLTPDFEIGCKRILISNDWYRALTQPHVDVVSGIRDVREHSVVTADGAEHEVDTIIAGTGFDVIHPSIAARIIGRDGRTLADTWAGRPVALHGTTVHGFPNFFRLGGPGTIIGHNSHVGQIEAQVAYIIDALSALDVYGARSAEPRAHVQATDAAARHDDLARTVFSVGGCRSWYQDESGVATVNWPRSARRFRRELTHFDPAADAVAAARNLAFSSGVRPALDAATATTLEPLETDTPVTIAWGRRDLLLSASQRHRIQALIPTADIVLLDGCGHLPITDDPDAVARLILARTCASRREPIHA
jgi:cation diffusion facilitator CzcD-associated flavoprotein CzcO